MLALGFRAFSNQNSLEVSERIQNLIEEKKARIGVCVIYDTNDTICVNANDNFPMASVYKFPQAIYLAEFLARNELSLKDSITVSSLEVHQNTWSPMRDKLCPHVPRDFTITIEELLAYSLQQSDNIACDVLFRLIGGPSKVNSYLRKIGFGQINVVSTEAEMHNDNTLTFVNSSTPRDMVRLVDYFNRVLRTSNGECKAIANLLEKCDTGLNRIVKPLQKHHDLVVGHKTGTGDVDFSGKIMAINDVGYVNLADGRKYSLAIFISDSEYDLTEAEGIIAEISEIIYQDFIAK